MINEAASLLKKIIAVTLNEGIFHDMSITEQVIQKVKGMSEDQARELLLQLERQERADAEEDALDLEAARRALADPGENIPWEKVKTDLGLK